MELNTYGYMVFLSFIPLAIVATIIGNKFKFQSLISAMSFLIISLGVWAIVYSLYSGDMDYYLYTRPDFIPVEQILYDAETAGIRKLLFMYCGLVFGIVFYLSFWALGYARKSRA